MQSVNWRSLLLTIALVFSSATQIRFADALGVGELFGMGFILVGMFMVSAEAIAKYKIELLCLLGFWVCLLLGIFVNEAFEISKFSSYRDLLAIAYCLLLVAVAIAQPNDQINGLDVMACVGAAVTIVALIQVALFLLALQGISVLAINVWGFDEEAVTIGTRFQGWGTNPNQLGFVIATGLFVILKCINDASTRFTRIWYGVIAACLVLIEILIMSDAVAIAWAISVTLGIAYLVYRNPILRPAALVVNLIVFGLFIALILPGMLDGSINKNDSNDGNGRFPLWLHGIQAWRASPVFGLGPGGHSGFLAPFEGIEAHSIFIDTMFSGGLLAASLLAFLYLRAALRGLGSTQKITLLFTVSLFFESLVHNSLRHPIYWFYLVLPLMMRGAPIIVPPATDAAARS